MTAAAKALLFDLDGTLLDSLADLGESMNTVLSELGLPPHPLDAYRQFVGDGVVELARRALPQQLRSTSRLQECVDCMRRVYGQRWALKTRPYPGIEAMLDTIAAAGLPMAILSNKPDDFTQAVVARLLGRWPFGPVRGARDDTPRKPDPQAALEIAAELGVAASEVLYVGDTPTDMKTASAAGMIAAGALWGFRGAEELRHAGARLLFGHPREITEQLGVREESV